MVTVTSVVRVEFADGILRSTHSPRSWSNSREPGPFHLNAGDDMDDMHAHDTPTVGGMCESDRTCSSTGQRTPESGGHRVE